MADTHSLNHRAENVNVSDSVVLACFGCLRFHVLASRRARLLPMSRSGQRSDATFRRLIDVVVLPPHGAVMSERSTARLLQLNLRGKLGAEQRTLHRFALGRVKELHRAGFRTMPDLLCAGVKVERRFLPHFRFRVARGKHFHANLRGAGKTRPVTQLMQALGRRPRHICRLDTVGRGDRAFGEDTAVRDQCSKQVSDFGLVASVACGRRRTHDDVSKAVRFNAAFEAGQFAVGEQLVPATEIELCLLSLPGQFDGQG